jgi:hypothetical protein
MPRTAWSGCQLQSTAIPLVAMKGHIEFDFGSGAGIRTLNLAVNSRLLYR